MPGELGNLNTKNWENLESLADSLEQAWKGGCPDINEFLPPPGSANRAVILHELIKTDMECRWRHGQAIVLDYYLEKFAADLGPSESLPAALIYEEYRVRQLFGRGKLERSLFSQRRSVSVRMVTICSEE